MFLNPQKRQEARAANAARARLAALTGLPASTPIERLLVASEAALARRRADRAETDRLEREARIERERLAREALGALVLVGDELRLYRRREIAPANGRVETVDALDAAVGRARFLRVVGHHGTSAPISLPTLRRLAAPMLPPAEDSRCP